MISFCTIVPTFSKLGRFLGLSISIDGRSIILFYRSGNLTFEWASLWVWPKRPEKLASSLIDIRSSIFLLSPCFCADFSGLKTPTVLRFTIAKLSWSESYCEIFRTFFGEVVNWALNASRFVTVGSFSITSPFSHSSICKTISTSGLALFSLFEYAFDISTDWLFYCWSMFNYLYGLTSVVLGMFADSFTFYTCSFSFSLVLKWLLITSNDCSMAANTDTTNYSISSIR